MRVIIIGAGDVGTEIASNLAPNNDVVVIDVDSTRVDELKYNLDVLTIAGDGTASGVLQEAGVGDAELLIACTNDDLINLVSCGTAKTFGDPFTIARVKSTQYQTTWEATESAYGVDFMVCSDLETAKTIVNVLGLPAAIDVDSFADGLVQMAEFEVSQESPIAGQTVAEADRFKDLTFASLFRNNEMLLPDGETVIKPNDRAVVIGTPESVQTFSMDLTPEASFDAADDVVIVGGTEIGYQTARLLQQRGIEPMLIEQEEARARELAEDLSGTVVMHHDGTDTEFLQREHVDRADVLVSALSTDEKNMLVSVLAKRIGTKRVLSIVDQGSYVDLFTEIGIDAAINPRTVTAEEITRFTHQEVAINVSVIEGDDAEILELELSPESELVGQTIKEIDDATEAELVFGAVTRDQTYLSPRGSTRLEAGDHIIVFVETAFVEDIISMS